MSTPLQDAAAALTSTDRAILVVATHAEEGAEYEVVWSGDEFDALTDVADQVSYVRTDLALARMRTDWPS